MALELNILTRLRELISREEKSEDLVLEHKLVDLFSQLRKWEDSNAPKLSVAFDERVLAHLKTVEIDNPSWKEKVLPYLLENKPMQYGLSVAMASVLAVVLISRSASPVTETIAESAGVIIENTSYLDRPSSIEYADSYHKRVFLDQVKQDPKSLETLNRLENYYISTGRKSVASEIRTIIEEASR
ncbi:hypothetical protein [Leptospira sp. GIMC2001]|uniref:hypothetical protein n=1 Tax=Leptospira sp. GIMC2001 TaxID=1513297 RepID=UPI00234BAEE0|nr:hypothetical protein [Leptospira sp. GIMC2001]WCL50478.1 hypothetical protein O4O04_06555 [Leptospira sp. GIMC2001]